MHAYNREKKTIKEQEGAVKCNQYQQWLIEAKVDCQCTSAKHIQQQYNLLEFVPFIIEGPHDQIMAVV